MVLNDWLGYSAVDSLGEIIYVLCDRARLRHLPGSISLTVYLYIIIKHSFIHFLTSLIHERGFKVESSLLSFSQGVVSMGSKQGGFSIPS